jgi:hypothetical protein
MTIRIRLALVAALSTLGLGAVIAPASQASLLSVLPGSCGNQPASQPFAQYGDYNDYTPALTPWQLSGGASVTGDSVSLPAGSSATSQFMCTNIWDPTLRLFVRNTGSPSSQLAVQVLIPGLLGGVQSATVAELTGSSSWQPSPAIGLLLNNLFSTLSLSQTSIAFRFVPADSTGNWSITGVYLDPWMRG